MKRKLCKFLAALICAAIVLGFYQAPTSYAAETKTLDQVTIYKPESESSASFRLNDFIKLKTLSSSSKYITPTEYYYNCDKYSQGYEVVNGKLKEKKSKNNGYINVYLKCKKYGSAKIKFRSDNTTYIVPVKVKKYVNPLKSLTITNVNKGKNIAKKYNKQSALYGLYELNLSKSGKVKLSATAKAGWEIISARLVNRKYNDKTYSHEISRDYTGKSSASLTMSDFDAESGGFIYVVLRNKTDNGLVEIYANIGKN